MAFNNGYQRLSLTFVDHLEKQFSQLREQYYTERINQIERQSAEVRNGRSEEYLQPLKELDKVYKNRIEVAEILKRYRLENIENKFNGEEQAALQNFEVTTCSNLKQKKEELKSGGPTIWYPAPLGLFYT